MRVSVHAIVVPKGDLLLTNISSVPQPEYAGSGL